MMIGIRGLDVFLPTMEDRFRGQEFRENASDRPNVWKKSLFCRKIQQPEVREVMEKWKEHRLDAIAQMSSNPVTSKYYFSFLSHKRWVDGTRLKN